MGKEERAAESRLPLNAPLTSSADRLALFGFGNAWLGKQQLANSPA